MRPYRIEIPDSELADLRARIASTRWPTAVSVPGWERGVPADYLRELATYWQSTYDWRAAERELNQYPQFITEIDGTDVHFLHVTLGGAGRDAAAAHPRLARFDRRVPRRHRPAHRPPRARPRPRAGVPPGHPVHPRARLLRSGHRARLGRQARRRGVGGADAAARLRLVRHRGRRLGFDHLPRARPHRARARAGCVRVDAADRAVGRPGRDGSARTSRTSAAWPSWAGSTRSCPAT